MKDTACIILAAGKGVRMKSPRAKVLHPLCGRPMVSYVIDLVNGLKIGTAVAVLGHKKEEVKKYIPPTVRISVQKRLVGTADAVAQGLKALKSFKGTVLILYADNPLLKKETIKKLLAHHKESAASVTLLTARLKNPSGYGRILRDRFEGVSGIIEEKDADDFQKDIKEVNTGIMCFDARALASSLKKVRPNNRKKEYYLTDTISILYKTGSIVEGVKLEDPNESLGINSRLELAKAQSIMQQRINEQHMKDGVTIVDPNTAFIDFGAKIGEDSTIYPFTVIESNVKIGKRCSVGPFIRLRQGACLKNDVVVGNFLEVSRSTFNSKARAKHFGFIGDCRVGKAANIGAGTVTANYDGKHKNITVIGDGAFIGSDTVLVAPVRIGKASKTGAGSVVVKNRNVADGKTVAGVPARPLQ